MAFKNEDEKAADGPSPMADGGESIKLSKTKEKKVAKQETVEKQVTLKANSALPTAP